MKTESELSWKQTQNLVDDLVFQVTRKHLGASEIQVLHGAWCGKTYEAIASESFLAVKYIGEVGGRLWSNLSEALGEDVKKTNFRQALQRQWEKQASSYVDTATISDIQPSIIELNEEPFIERPNIESYCYQEISKPGALLRIHAPLQFGKTELMSRVIEYALSEKYRTVVLNLRDAVTEDFQNLDNFLQWFIVSISETLQIEQSVEEHWHKSLGNCKIKCRTYFEKYILPRDNPIVITLDELDKLFPHEEIAGEFLGVLRTWHEYAKTKPIWQQLRLLILHREVYNQININQSPFNTGTEIKLTDFNSEQVESLANKYKLNWGNTQVKQLMAMVGGHPYLIKKAIEEISRQGTTLENLLKSAPTASGCYRTHLERHLRYLQSNTKLLDIFKEIVLSDYTIQINTDIALDDAVKLYDCGLVELSNNSVSPRYQLYRLYFQERLVS
ncbi:MAG: AAA-like domain-containing protein [Rivularia sp. (in: Bacteria)]|nr:AAA-like domain-containing protein [Rivularia sp. MS3]